MSGYKCPLACQRAEQAAWALALRDWEWVLAWDTMVLPGAEQVTSCAYTMQNNNINNNITIIITGAPASLLKKPLNQKQDILLEWLTEVCR